MKKIIGLVIVLGMFSPCFSALYTWTGGKYSVSTNFTPNGTPVKGDSFYIAASAKCTSDVNFVIGNNAANTTYAVIDSGSWVFSPSVICTAYTSIAITNNSKLSLDSGSQIIFNGTFKIQPYSGCTLTTANNGSRTNMSTIRAITGQYWWYPAPASGASNFTPHNTKFIRIGGGSSWAFQFNGGGAYQEIKPVRCLFDSIGYNFWYLYPSSQPSTSSKFIIDSCDFRHTYGGYLFAISDGSVFNFAAESHKITNSTMAGDAGAATTILARFGNTTNPFIFDNCIIRTIAITNPTNIVFKNCGYYGSKYVTTVFNNSSAAGVYNIYENMLMYSLGTNVHGFTCPTTLGTWFWNNVTINAQGDEQGNTYLMSEQNGAIARVGGGINIGDNACIIRAGTNSNVAYVDNLTNLQYASADALALGENTSAKAQSRVRSCLEWSPSFPRFVVGSTTTADTAWKYMDYNGYWGKDQYHQYDTVNIAITGKSFKDAGFGASDVYANPNFRDTTAGLAKYAKLNGADSSVAAFWNEMFAMNGFDTNGVAKNYNSVFDVKKANAYIRKSYKPTNALFKGTGFGGTDIGGVPWIIHNLDTFSVGNNKAVICSLSASFKFSPDSTTKDSARCYLRNITTGIITDSTQLNIAGTRDTLTISGNSGINKYTVFAVGTSLTGAYTDTTNQDSILLPSIGPKIPVIDSVSPAKCYQSGGTTIRLYDHLGGFLTASTVTVGGGAVTVTRTDSTQLSFTSPAHAGGAVAVIVTNDSAKSDTVNLNYISRFTLTVSTTGSGTSTPSTGSVDSGVSTAINNTPAANWGFKSWAASGGATLGSSATTNPNTVVLTANGTVTATDTTTTYYVTLNGAGSFDGSTWENASALSTFKAGTAPYDVLAGKTIYIGDAINTQLTIPAGGTVTSRAIIRGDYPGHPCTITQSAGTQTVRLVGRSYVTVRGFSTVYTGTNVSASGVNLNGAVAGDSIIDMTLNCGGYGYGVTGDNNDSGCAVVNCAISNCAKYQVYFYGATNSYLTANHIVSSGGYGIFIQNSAGVTVQNDTINSVATNYAMHIYNCSGVLTGSNFYSTGGADISLYINKCDFSAGSTFNGVRIGTTTQYGMRLDSVSGLAMRNINTLNTPQRAIDIISSHDNSFTLCSLVTITTSGGYGTGILFKDTSSASYNDTFTDCYVHGAGGDAYRDVGSTHDLLFSRCEARKSGTVGFNFGVASGTGANLTFTNCIADSCGSDGFMVDYNVHDVTYNYCIARNNGDKTSTANGDGFTGHRNNYNITLNYCLSYRNTCSGYAYVDSCSGTLYNCEAFNNAGAWNDLLGGSNQNQNRGGLYFNLLKANPTTSTAWTVRNFIGTLNYPREVFVSSIGKSLVNFDYNLYFSQDSTKFANLNDLGGNDSGWGKYKHFEPHSTYGYAKFADTAKGDFRITDGSPAITEGVDVGLTTYYDGTAITGAQTYQGAYYGSVSSGNGGLIGGAAAALGLGLGVWMLFRRRR